MSDHHFHWSAGPFTVLLFYYFISTGFQAEVASGVAKPDCRATIFTCRPDRLLFYYFTISFPLRSRQEVLFASRTAFPACQLTFLHVGQMYPYIRRPETKQVTKYAAQQPSSLIGCASKAQHRHVFGCLPIAASEGCARYGFQKRAPVPLVQEGLS